MHVEYQAVSEIQAEVLGYLKAHPDAADTAEGIRQWWLFQRMARYSQDKVLIALVQLKDAQLVVTQTLENGEEVFLACNDNDMNQEKENEL